MRRRRLLTIKKFDLPFLLMQLLVFSYLTTLFGFFGVALTIAISWFLLTLKKKDLDIFQVLVRAIRTDRLVVSTPEFQLTGRPAERNLQQKVQPSPSRTKMILRTVISAIKSRRKSFDFL